jgi:hypothetical protein
MRRWFHERARAADMRFIKAAIDARAETPDRARQAWEAFTRQKGQEHWRCPCARGEPAERPTDQAGRAPGA